MTNKITIEDHQIVVAELFPMSEVEDFVDVLAYKEFGSSYLTVILYYSPEEGCMRSRDNSDLEYTFDQLIGWHPIPVYKPNKPEE